MKEKRKPFISVIIPTYHDWERLQLCLEALERQTYPQDKFEVLVVNNDPEDVAPSTLKLPNNCKLLSEAKPGSYAARNKALSVAKGEVYAFTDSDCQPKKNWLEVAVKFFDNNPEYDRIGGEIELFSLNNKWNWFEIYELIFAFPQETFVNESGMAATGNMIAKKHVFEQVGMFNEALMSGGDGEWGRRANLRGFKIKFLKECKVLHPTRATFNSIIIKNNRLLGGHLTIAKNNGGAAIAKLLIRTALPPITAFKRAIKFEGQPPSNKIKAMLVSYCIKLTGLMELFKLMLIKQDCERK